MCCRTLTGIGGANCSLGGQAKTILVSHLQRSGRFQVMDRANLTEIAQEAGFNKQAANIKGARYVITGDVTAFGRKVTGDHQLFGLLGRGKEQLAYAKVDVNVVGASTSEVVYSASGAGEYTLSNREVIGFGGSSGYDSTLNGKVLDLAIREAVNRLVEGIDIGAILSVAMLTGCAATTANVDYSAFRESKPASILILPPLNSSVEAGASSAVLAQATFPLAESGYYVLPVAVVDETFRQNGLFTAGDIHALAPSKLHEVFGADTALYIDVKRYGSGPVQLCHRRGGSRPDEFTLWCDTMGG